MVQDVIDVRTCEFRKKKYKGPREEKRSIAFMDGQLSNKVGQVGSEPGYMPTMPGGIVAINDRESAISCTVASPLVGPHHKL